MLNIVDRELDIDVWVDSQKLINAKYFA